MGKDLFSLDAQGALSKNRSIQSEGESTQGIGKKQQAAAEALMQANKGGFAKEGFNGSVSSANTFTSAGNLHNANADNSQRYVKQGAQAEDASAGNQATQSRAVETTSQNLAAKVNRVQG